jgi:hypothetical protein
MPFGHKGLIAQRQAPSSTPAGPQAFHPWETAGAV